MAMRATLSMMDWAVATHTNGVRGRRLDLVHQVRDAERAARSKPNHRSTWFNQDE